METMFAGGAEPESAIMQPVSLDFPLLGELERALEGESAKAPSASPSPRRAPFESLPLQTRAESFLLMDEDETLKVADLEEFMHLLDCPNDGRLQVLSIFGNSGDGKSHTLNHLLFRGREVFKTSSSAETGPPGVWAAWEPARRLLCVDTPHAHAHKHATLHHKVMGVSDIVIYRTRAERLPSELFVFLGQASEAYTQHFQHVLKSCGQVSSAGPTVIISHEPHHTAPLTTGKLGESPSEQILWRVRELGLSTSGLGQLHYVGGASSLLAPLLTHNKPTRSGRSPEQVFLSLSTLCRRFRGRLTCQEPCRACPAKCQMSMGHLDDGVPHHTMDKCRYQQQFENKVLVCQRCQNKVKTVWPAGSGVPQESVLGLAYSAWQGYELICPRCGPLYKSRQFWFGNKSPEDSVVNTETVHVWPERVGSSAQRQESVRGRQVLEGVGSLASAITSYWIADSMAPAYWQPTSQITNCCVCRCLLSVGQDLHHCRSCGQGVCGSCSTARRPVPARGWPQPVRVCDHCLETTESDEAGDVLVRKAGEYVCDVLSPLTAALKYPKDILTELARPSYWQPDEAAPHCSGCELLFGAPGSRDARHHCRACGNSFCSNCSPHRRTVPERGWHYPVRVCSGCKDTTTI